ncbi:MAG: ABC transporter ATP-binding protein [Deltaproteobacteria bacterium]|nr:MAG: ABC transporter ATP-binding protein [Deltaproteobacteria bacterium]
MTLLDVSNLSIGYRLRDRLIKAVDSVSFSLEPGKTLGFVGESGSGKTTIGMSLLRLLPENASVLSGSIRFEGRDVYSLSDESLRAIRWKKIAMIFQAAMNALNPVQRINEQVAEALLIHHPKMSKRDALARTAQLFESVGIPENRHADYPHQYSGGMKQRAIIAMALICQPLLLIADEPTTALDVIVQGQILKVIRAIQQEMAIAMIFISHDISVVADVCHDIAVMYGGRIIEAGQRSEILETPAHPYTRMLLASNLTLSDHSFDMPTVHQSRKANIRHLGSTKENDMCPFVCHCRQITDHCQATPQKWMVLSSSHRVFCNNIAGDLTK